MKDNKILVYSVLPGSIAEEAGIEPGDKLVSINNEQIKDIFDYRFLIAAEELVLAVEKPDGDIWEVEIEKDEYEDLGIEFEESMIDEARGCTNKCVFCFIDQLPGGMRETLYFKDDDSRLSFLMGNYVTLTNMGDDDLERIVKYKMSPINVSVHTTNPDLRIFMLKNRFAGDILMRVKRLVDGGITVNCQIVLCRGMNDGDELDRSIGDLTKLYPGVRSISVVPVGITRYRKGLADLKPYDRESSLEVVRQVERWQEKLLKDYGSRIVYIADEFYIMADVDLPEYEAYEDFPQIENGVGLVSQLKYEFDEHLRKLDGKRLKGPRHVSIVTGVSSYKYIKEMARQLEDRFDGLNVEVHQIKNTFFGENVTVTGLLTGQDLISQLEGKKLGDELLICRCMLRAGEDVLLDDITVGMLENRLDVKVTAVDNSGMDFIDKIVAMGD